MKWNAIIILVLGLIVIGAAALALLHMSSSEQSAPGNSTARASPAPVPPPARTDVLEKFSVMREKINASGQSYGGAAVQVIDGDETAMVYIYKPVGLGDVSGLLASGFSALYATFDVKDPLLVGVVDTTQKINPRQYKVDIYSLERPIVAEYLKGNMTVTELAKKALFVTPETASLHPDNSTRVKKSLDVSINRSGYYAPPPDRMSSFNDSMNSSGYSTPLSMQAGPLSDGTKAVSVVMPMKNNPSVADKYSEIESILRACAASYGDYDRYMISLMPSQEGVYDYYYVDASALPAIAFANGNIDQYQLYKAINLTYYTK